MKNTKQGEHVGLTNEGNLKLLIHFRQFKSNENSVCNFLKVVSPLHRYVIIINVENYLPKLWIIEYGELQKT